MTTPDAHTLYTQSLQWFKQGKSQLALSALQEAVTQHPTEPQYPLQLAAFQRELGHLDQARETLSLALNHCPEHAPLYYELGCLFHVAGQLEHALNYYRQALQFQPDLAEGWHQLGRLLQQLERPEQASDAYAQALQLAPEQASFANSAGLHAYFQRDAVTARKAFAQALEHTPTTASETRARYLFHQALAYLLEPVDFEPALEALAQACTLKPTYLNDILQMAEDFLHQHSYAIAEGFLRLALHHASDLDTRFQIHLKLAHCFHRLGAMQSALDHYQEALALRPDRWLIEVQAGLLLPQIYPSVESVLQWRDRYALALQYFLEKVAQRQFPRSVQSLALEAPTFLLAYQGLHHKDLLQLTSQLWRQLLHLPEHPPQPLPKAAPQAPRKIAIISAFLFDHSLSGVYQGLVEHWAQRPDIELHFFALGPLHRDDFTAYLQTLGAFHFLNPQQTLPELADKILQVAPDILLYPEVGSEALSYFLAHLRLAPVQAAFYGHPVTTGISTVDYFLSPEVLEVPEAQDHYTEELVRLPHVPFTYAHQSEVETFDREAHGFSAEEHLYLVPSALFKVHPKMDAVFAEIYARDPQAVFCFIAATGNTWREQLQARLSQSLPAAAVRFIPHLARPAFFGLLQAADAVLDTFYFASGNVTYQSFALGVPLLTLPGRLMRSRTTAGIYEWLEISDCTAHNEAHFVELCVKMATDPDFKQGIQAQLNRAAPRLFDIAEDVVKACHRIEALYASH